MKPCHKFDVKFVAKLFFSHRVTYMKLSLNVEHHANLKGYFGLIASNICSMPVWANADIICSMFGHCNNEIFPTALKIAQVGSKFCQVLNKLKKLPTTLKLTKLAIFGQMWSHSLLRMKRSSFEISHSNFSIMVKHFGREIWGTQWK